MSDHLIFMMGKFEARIPTERLFAENHLWLKPAGDSYHVGFTAYSVRLLQDVYFLSWSIDPQTVVKHKQEIGEIESSKALSTLYAPSAGTILEFNEQLLHDPSAINTDPYESGWLYTFRPAPGTALLEPAAYVSLLDAGWEKTQRLIKGQMND